jgi:hypothetical protein
MELICRSDVCYRYILLLVEISRLPLTEIGTIVISDDLAANYVSPMDKSPVSMQWSAVLGILW